VSNVVARTKGGTQAERVLENRVLRRIFGHKMDEITKEWSTHREVSCSPIIIRIIQSRRQMGKASST
jgi:hypothetical protein